MPTKTQMLPQKKLLFFVDNPRVFSVVRANGKQPTQEEIQQQLSELEHVKELREDIKRNGGLIEPLIVRGGSFEVLEGNSRLASYRQLAEKDPIKWGMVKCTVLPYDVQDSLVFALLGQFHIKGKKDWAPYEQASVPVPAYRTTASAENPRPRTRPQYEERYSSIETYQFMVDHDEVATSKWSYYDDI